MSKPNLATLARLCYERAKVSGALMFTPTTLHINQAAGIDFEIRLVAALAQKPTKPMNREHGPRPPRVNPFLPYDPELYVTSHQDFHILLNKFCVAPRHLLIVTKGNVANAVRQAETLLLGVYHRLADNAKRVKILGRDVFVFTPRHQITKNRAGQSPSMNSAP
ncbi:bifunctional AP-4-A phosphorylase/ADP sulfurylase [Tieghemiomyces parasiticus]|uniref:Bifunctional AP-4-A phosphorylase/ADP sulfurylase n=1 Tax=Tieghemiomyces parasiticus TaxID=78921 RepID=A0A9W7ZQG3_9FUNG|nr:bifunctional AP-4-A phosphorylase/ADP sulfurylase [Tieghemiomyces parasiticus]